MRKAIAISMLVGMMICLTACGGDYDIEIGTNTETQKSQLEMDYRKYDNSSAHYLYCQDEGDEDIYQFDFNGNLNQIFTWEAKEQNFEIVEVTEKYIYICEEVNDFEELVLWRAPLEMHDGDEVIQEEKKEEIFSGKLCAYVIVGDQELYYENGAGNIYVKDLDSGTYDGKIYIAIPVVTDDNDTDDGIDVVLCLNPQQTELLQIEQSVTTLIQELYQTDDIGVNERGHVVLGAVEPYLLLDTMKKSATLRRQQIMVYDMNKQQIVDMKEGNEALNLLSVMEYGLYWKDDFSEQAKRLKEEMKKKGADEYVRSN